MLTREELERYRKYQFTTKTTMGGVMVDIKKLTDHIDQLESLLRRCDGELREQEWETVGQYSYCRACQSYGKHEQHCYFVALIRDITDAVGGDK